jgi:K+-sensing histidine kinase KdpD
MPRYLDRDRLAIVAALVAPLVVLLVLVPFRESFANTNVALLLVVVVVAVAAHGHRVAGALAAVSAALWFNFFFTEPYQRFTINRPEDIETTVLLLIVGLAVSQLAARARELRVVAITDAGYLARVHDTAELAQSTTSPAAVVDLVKGHLTDLLDLRGCCFEYGSLMGQPPRLEQDGTVTWGRKNWDVDRMGLPETEVELRTFGNGHFYGRFMLDPTPGKIPPLQARLVAVTLADQVGAALDTATNP